MQLRRAGIEAESLAQWRGGAHRLAVDPRILSLARTELRVFVTFDLQTVPDLLKALAVEGEAHAGVILVDDATIRQDDVGGLVRALRKIIDQQGTEDWADRVIYLARA